MAITDISISEELQTNAPSIKYRGNEGPKSPQEIEKMMMAQLEEEYKKYVDEMIEMGREGSIISIEQFMEQAMAEGQMSGGQPLPQDPTKPVNPFAPKPTGPTLPNRQMAAYGGIMGLDGRKQYGIGSWLKKKVRNIIPNEVADIAVKAAPFIAPFNPLAAGLMSGIGGFDQHGSISKGLKSGLMNYGLGNVARWAGGAGPQWGLSNPNAASGSFMDTYLSSPRGTKTGIGKWLDSRKAAPIPGDGVPDLSQKELLATGTEYYKNPALQAKYGSVREYQNFIASQQAPNLNFLDKAVSTFTNMSPLAKGALGAGAITALLNMGPEETVSEIMDRGEGLDIEGIRAEVIEAYKDSTGKKLEALRVKYPFLGTQGSKNIAAMANGGRIGFNMGGGADMGAPQMGEIQTFMKSNSGTDYVQTVMESLYQQNQDKYQSPEDPQLVQDALMVVQESMAPFKLSESRMKNNLSRINRAEGGLMDLGGMEKDYRAEGGFVPIGAKEKADDVPARLSVNEFVFTADAVRNAGGGDIDKGAEVMENMMKNLEAGGQVSEESQGMAGAQQMFETSERLSEVI